MKKHFTWRNNVVAGAGWLVAISSTIGGLPAGQEITFAQFVEQDDLPAYFRYDVEGTDSFSKEKISIGSEGLTIGFVKDRHGTFSGVVPSLVIANAGDTWKISATVSFDWYGANNLSNAYPAGGLVIFTGKKDYISFGVVHNGRQENDFVEIRSVLDGQSLRINGFNDPFLGDQVRAYTLTIEKNGSGRILFSYTDGKRSGVLLAIDGNGGGNPEKRAGLVTPDGTAFDGPPDYSKFRVFLDNLVGKQVGLFVDGHLYSVENPERLSFSTTFKNLSLEALKAENAHD
jgi:hypothetical protein